MEAQSRDFYVTKTGMSINPQFIKASGEDFLFKPFNVSTYQSLESALLDSKVGIDTELMVFEVAGKTLALIKKQLAYHHVAQGKLDGEAWAACF